eukprot:m.88414 g.88414  ORF g.88414 m.88414 type:complete len:308 (-) comp12264_c0_seq1:44-967(-)
MSSSLSVSTTLTAPSSSILIQDDFSCSGDVLLKETLNALLSSGKRVVYVQAEPKRPLIQSHLKKNLEFVSVPWRDFSPPMAKEFLQKCVELVKKLKCSLFIDSISALSAFVGSDHTCVRFIQMVQQVDAKVAVFCVLHKHTFAPEHEQTLSHLFNTQVTLRTEPGDTRAIAHTVHMKKGGRTSSVKEHVWVDHLTNTFHSLPYKQNRFGLRHLGNEDALEQTNDSNDNDPTANLTFNLSLSEQEKHTRANTALPYMDNTQGKRTTSTTPTTSTASSSSKATGRGVIYYEPDEVDDFDDEDPDDDLDL